MLENYTQKGRKKCSRMRKRDTESEFERVTIRQTEQRDIKRWRDRAMERER
jgi:hypothetical protein